ncbi:hypothetical protein T484DRAFT_1768586 [Baffinella frigidus]|nr:hypothetical protein T484DRAFT_1768586 [Cryptophyta sp. CCMP2293]
MAAWQSSLVLAAITRCAETLLGPAGTVKLVVPAGGAVPGSSSHAVCDGAGLLDVLDAQHPAATFLREAVHAQSSDHGTGGTLLVVLAGLLAERSARLVHWQGLSPLGVAGGLRRASEAAAEFLPAAAVPITDLIRSTGEDASRGGSRDVDAAVGTAAVAAGLAHGCDNEMRLAVAAVSLRRGQRTPQGTAPGRTKQTRQQVGLAGAGGGGDDTGVA